MSFNKKTLRYTAASSLALALSLSAPLSQAGNAFGLTYSSGFKDIMDWHEDSLPYVDVSGLGLGFSYRYIHDFNKGLRLDLGAGYFGVFGDVEYYDIPLTATIGYNFMVDGDFKPYIRGGLSYHIMDGDYIESTADVGFIGALGAEFGSGRVNFFAEVAYDTAEATISCYKSTYYCTGSKQEVAINDVMLTMGVKF